MTTIETPVPRPDEWLNGYLVRMQYWNVCKDRQRLYELIHRKIPFSHSSIIHALAILLNRPEHEIAFHHTLIPAIRAITETKCSDSVLSKMATRTMQEETKFCIRCINEDLEYLGYPYLRRSHQVIGSDWCLKHQNELMEIISRETPGIKTLISQANIEICQRPSLSEQHPIIQKYVGIYDGLMTFPSELSAEGVSWILAEQAEKVGFNRSAAKTTKCLSDMLIEEISSPWLFKHFPIFKSKQPNILIPSFDHVTNFRYQNHAVRHYVLAAAALFESADDALNALSASTMLEVAPSRPMVKRPGSFWWSEELKGVYIKHIGQAKEISDEIGGTYDQNRLNLIKHGLPPLGGLSNETIYAINDFYDEIPEVEILLRPGVNREHYEQIVQKARAGFNAIFIQIKDYLLEKNKLRVSRIPTSESVY